MDKHWGYKPFNRMTSSDKNEPVIHTTWIKLKIRTLSEKSELMSTYGMIHLQQKEKSSVGTKNKTLIFN